MADMEASQAEAGDASMEPAKETYPMSVLTLSLMQVIKTAQAQHGLRHGDYTRYRCVWVTMLHATCSQHTIGSMPEPAATGPHTDDGQPLSPAGNIAHDGCSACTRRSSSPMAKGSSRRRSCRPRTSQTTGDTGIWLHLARVHVVQGLRRASCFASSGLPG